MSLALVVGVGIVMAVMLFMAFNLDKEHEFLKSILIIFSFAMLLIIPASIFDNCDNCDTFISNQTELYVYGNNFTDNSIHWDEVHSGDNPDFSDKILNEPDGVFLFHKNITYEYETICSCETGGSLAFIKAVKWVYVVFIAYLIVYLFVKSSFFLSMTNNRRRKR